MSKKIDASLFRRGFKNNEWDFKYIENNKEESALLFHQNFQIKNYINKILNSHGFFTMMFKAEYSITKLTIYISVFESNSHKITSTKKKKSNSRNLNTLVNKYLLTTLKNYYKVNNINIKIKNLTKSFENKLIKSKTFNNEFKKILSNLKFYRKNIKQLEIIKVAFIVICNKNSAQLLSNYINYLISTQQNKYNTSIFLSFKTILTKLINSKLSKVAGISITISGRINGYPRAKKRQIKIGTLPLQSIASPVEYYRTTVYTNNGTLGLKTLICNKKLKLICFYNQNL